MLTAIFYFHAEVNNLQVLEYIRNVMKDYPKNALTYRRENCHLLGYTTILISLSLSLSLSLSSPYIVVTCTNSGFMSLSITSSPWCVLLRFVFVAMALVDFVVLETVELDLALHTLCLRDSTRILPL